MNPALIPALAYGAQLAVYTELWTSLASLLRSYTSAHGLHTGRQASVEVSAGAILVRVGERSLRLTHEAGEGRWQREQGPATAFILGLDGAVISGKATEEMDIVAERLAREIMQ